MDFTLAPLKFCYHNSLNGTQFVIFIACNYTKITAHLHDELLDKNVALFLALWYAVIIWKMGYYLDNWNCLLQYSILTFSENLADQ